MKGGMKHMKQIKPVESKSIIEFRDLSVPLKISIILLWVSFAYGFFLGLVALN